MTLACWQINLQEHFGGGEVYTRFLTQALSDLGCDVKLVVSPKARFWRSLDLRGAELVPASDLAAACAALPAEPTWVLTHGALPLATEARAQRHFLTGISHMPLYGRNPRSFDGYRLAMPVSEYVRASLVAAGVTSIYEHPLYGVADLARPVTGDGVIVSASPYDWDRRKVRDRLMGALHPLWNAVAVRRRFERRPGVTLGIVSRLTPIKQFPRMFELLAPVLAHHSQVNLEVFGSGGYASVRDLRRALAPIAGRTRFWGHQADVASVYRQLDFLLTGLPEKEALGLNVIEAQACGLPVLAVAAPPFTETVLDGRTGHFYRDPREDQGADFERLIASIESGGGTLDPRTERAHLERFSYAAFLERVRALAHRVATEMGGRA